MGERRLEEGKEQWNILNSKVELGAAREKGMGRAGEQWDEGAACGRRLNRNKMCIKEQ